MRADHLGMGVRRGLGRAALASVAALTLIPLAPLGAAATYYYPDGSMSLVSTPNSVFGAGRNPTSMYTFTRVAQDLNAPEPEPWQVTAEAVPGTRTWDERAGPKWILYLRPDGWTAGDEISVDLLTSDFGLASQTGSDQWAYPQWLTAQEACPELSGSVSVDELERDAAGMPVVIAFTFRLDCGEGDTTWGAFALGTDLPPLPEAAQAIAAADQAVPRPTGIYGRLLTASPSRQGDVTLGWRHGDGFLCADAQIADAESGRVEHHYKGMDDDYTGVDLDWARPYEVSLKLWHNEVPSCGTALAEDAETDAVSLNPVTVSMAGDRSAPFGDAIPVRGRVEFPFGTADVAAGPAVNTRVELWSSSGEDDTLLGTTRTDARGSFRFDVTPYRSTEIWTVIRPGRAGWQQRLIHFGATSVKVDHSVAHVVRASVGDPTVAAASSVEVSGRVLPGDDTTPVYLERKTRDGSWTRVDMAVTEPGQSVTLTLDEARPGWQALRVVAPNDGWHLRGVSNRLRVFGY